MIQYYLDMNLLDDKLLCLHNIYPILNRFRYISKASKIFHRNPSYSSKHSEIKFPNKKNLSPNIHTKYQRYYFYNRFKNIRCTVDVGLKIINVKNKLVKRFSDIIIEFKCDKKIIVNDVIKNANYNIRCSKYCIGIDLHNLAYEKY